MTLPVYLDYNGTTPLDPEVIAAMRPFLEEEFGNPSSSHWYGIKPKQAVEKARRQVAKLLGCLPEEIFFTSGGTESNNHAIKGIARALRHKGRHIITSAFEHPAVLEVCRYLKGKGFETTLVPVDDMGMLDPERVKQALRPDTILITVMHANNEVGTVQPVKAVAGLAREHGIVMHSDAAQSPGKIPVDVQVLGVDMLSIAGHKIYAPKGTGALYVRKGIAPEKFCHGAGQEKEWRAGTENVPGIVGLGKACEIAARDMGTAMTRMKEMRDRLHRGIAEKVPGIRLNGHPENRLPNTLSLSFMGLEANRLLEEIGLEVAASAGAACHAETVAVSHVLEAMRVPLEWSKGTLRFSVGRMTTGQEIDRAINAVVNAVTLLRSENPSL
ncbi:MAG TPA: cysteine desulfurase family protein [Spirochaetota bacterium]|nr:cysteine desulfurase family protein [Spirochaetota bacterium]HPI89001.1 cysteine desulfurase family protein [Spirochaetota bacterium]HPR47488.1 cysteine desulfurase family protein [Spirochaetota bacterium]